MRTLLVLVMLSSVARAEEPSAAVVKKFAAELKCDAASSDVLRSWCAVTKLGAQPFVPPKALTTYVGMTTALVPGAGVRDSLLSKLSMAALHLGPGTVRLTGIKPDNEDEKRQMLDATIRVSAVLKGKASSVDIDPGLADYLKSQQAKPGYKLEPGARSAKFTGQIPSEIFQVGEVYVVLEYATDGVFVNIFPITAPTVKSAH